MTTRGSATRALAAVRDKEGALSALRGDMLARGTRGSSAAILERWCEFHTAWFGPASPPFPLTVGKARAVMALLKAGGYSSAPNHLSAAWVASRDRGFPEDPLIAPEAVRLKRSCLRGIGQAKQTHALPLRRLGELTSDPEPWAPGGPIAPRDTLVLGSWFLMREIEMASAKIGDVAVSETAKEFSLTLRAQRPTRGRWA